MKKVKRKSQGLKLLSRVSLFKKFSGRHFEKGSYDGNILKRVLADLSKSRRRRRRASESVKTLCQPDNVRENAVELKARLRCRQLPSVVQHLRKAIMKQDWDEVTTLLIILCHPGLNYYKSIIIKVCFILLFSHSSSDINLLQNFIRLATEYILEEDVYKFIRILFALKKSALIPLKSGRPIRKTRDYKVTRDAEFEKL